MVKMLHSHVLFPLEPIPPAMKTAVQIGVNLKVHIQKIAPRIAPRRALSLYTHGGHRHAETRLTFAVDDGHGPIGTNGVGIAHHFQLIFDSLETVQQVFQLVSVTAHGDHLSNSARGY